MGLCKSFPLSGQPSKARGLPSCIRTTPIPFPEASHSIIKVFVKSGVVKTGDLHITSLSCSKYLVSSRVHENASFLVSIIKGVAIVGKYWTRNGHVLMVVVINGNSGDSRIRRIKPRGDLEVKAQEEQPWRKCAQQELTEEKGRHRSSDCWIPFKFPKRPIAIRSLEAA